MAAAKSWTTPCLLLVIAFQWILFTALLQRKESSSGKDDAPVVTMTANTKTGILLDATSKRSLVDQHARSAISELELPIGGVAATVIFRAPKWFHLRYKVMLDNALSNLPDATWKLQVYTNEPWIKDQLLPWHPGLKHMLADNPRIVVTPLPTNLTKGKPKEVVQSRWFWESLIADKVILFTGNGAFCGNHAGTVWSELLELDYCGVPWNSHGGIGGEGGSHSIRSRSATLQALDYADQHSIEIKSAEHRHILSLLLKMNQAGVGNFKVASVNQTVAFGGVYNLSSAAGLERLPLAVAGTHARLTYEERDSLLKHCPELKVIFPSLHEPSCFGAHPKAETCKATICALQDNVPSHGC